MGAETLFGAGNLQLWEEPQCQVGNVKMRISNLTSSPPRFGFARGFCFTPLFFLERHKSREPPGPPPLTPTSHWSRRVAFPRGVGKMEAGEEACRIGSFKTETACWVLPEIGHKLAASVCYLSLITSFYSSRVVFVLLPVLLRSSAHYRCSLTMFSDTDSCKRCLEETIGPMNDGQEAVIISQL